MREEILAGLRNAVARGQTPEQAAQSFINAGYNPQEVKAAYDMLTSGASTVIGNANASSGQGVQIQQNTRQAVGNYGNQQQGQMQQQQMRPQQPQQQAQNVQQNQQQAPQNQAAPGAPANNPPEKKKGSNTAVLVMMIVIAALIFLGALGYLFYVLYMNS